MSKENPDVTAARIEAERKRSQLMNTARDLQNRLSPKTLARDAWEGAKVKGADMAEDAVDAVRKRPYAAGGIVAAIALFLAREPIKDLAARIVGSGNDEDDEVIEELEELAQIQIEREKIITETVK